MDSSTNYCPNDHESLFGAGVACEKLKRFEDARKYYRRAKSLKADNAQYAAAVDRVSEFGSEPNQASASNHNKE